MPITLGDALKHSSAFLLQPITKRQATQVKTKNNIDMLAIPTSIN